MLISWHQYTYVLGINNPIWSPPHQEAFAIVYKTVATYVNSSKGSYRSHTSDAKQKIKVTRNRNPTHRYKGGYVGDASLKKDWDHKKTVLRILKVWNSWPISIV